MTSSIALESRRLALIRGINVGRAKRVPMAELRALVGDLGYGGVRTLLNSGNVVFTAAADADATPAGAAKGIEEGMESRLGVSARVTVLTGPEVVAIVRDNPLVEVGDDPSRLLVSVLAEPSDRARLEPLLEEEWAPESLALGERVAYLWCPAGVLESRLPKAVEGVVGDAVTTRNWRTFEKIHAAVVG